MSQAFYNWGNALSDWAALSENAAVKVERYTLACEKFSRTTMLDSEQMKAWHNLGLALNQLSELTEDEELKQLLASQAREQFAKAASLAI